MKKNTQSGFAMLFTVLIISIILSLAIGISSITFKQNLLSSIAKDSQAAFFAADSGIECGLLYDLRPENWFARGLNSGAVHTHYLNCDPMLFVIDHAASSESYIVFRENQSNDNLPCRTIVLNKTDPVVSKVQVRGYNICKQTPRQVERALEARYI